MVKVAPSARKRKLEGGERQARRRLRIGDLPDELVGAIVSRLPLKEAARTQVLSTRWRRIWRGYAPLNLDITDFGPGVFDVGDRTMDYILSRHPGPGRRLTLRASCIAPRPTAAKLQAWLLRPALRDLQHLQLRFDKMRLPPSERPPDYSAMILEPLPEAVMVLAKTLKILDVVSSAFPDAVQDTAFRCIKYLTLENIGITEEPFNCMVTASPCLQSIMLSCITGMDTIHISSISIRSIGFHVGPRTQQTPPAPPTDKLVIESCPLLQRLLILDDRHALHITIRDAPLLEAIGFLSDGHRIESGPSSSLTVTGSLSIQALQIDNLIAEVRGVTILAVNMEALNLDMIVNMLRCFPLLERLYIECVTGGKHNRWETKHKTFPINMSLRVVVVNQYRGTVPQSRFASFVLQKAGALSLMVLGVSAQYNNLEFQNKQLNSMSYSKRISEAALVRFRANLYGCFRYQNQFQSANDIDYPDPFMNRS